MTALAAVALLTMGRITSDGAGPHTDLLDDFPYLGVPHPAGPPVPSGASRTVLTTPSA